ncbi:hypothetical protein DD238_002182 [Peronospora effusa]|uniref:Uncharacterized protein n=1 Tax=Peronospora effusa TaxID=542832 RepID=A0A3M6VL43_9STRA|nr:hypothetical protein DD238_002182 [Peronospora effusa]
MRKVSIGHTEFYYAARREKQTTYGSSRDCVCVVVSSRNGVVWSVVMAWREQSRWRGVSSRDGVALAVAMAWR